MRDIPSAVLVSVNRQPPQLAPEHPPPCATSPLTRGFFHRTSYRKIRLGADGIAGRLVSYYGESLANRWARVQDTAPKTRVAFDMPMRVKDFGLAFLNTWEVQAIGSLLLIRDRLPTADWRPTVAGVAVPTPPTERLPRNTGFLERAR
jgi:hypothetical protein